jgi:hypothetical protein
MKEINAKIMITSESDLPKEDGEYIVHSKSFGWIGLAVWKNFENENYPEYNQYLWLLNYDWYLLPVLPSAIPTDDLLQYVTNLLYAAFDFNRIRSDKTLSKNYEFDKWVEEQIGLLKDFQSIHPQSSEREKKQEKLLEKASWLVGNPGTGISGSTDVACDNWQKDYEKYKRI